MKNNLPLLIAAAAIIVILWYLSASGKKAPIVPSDAVHTAITTQEGCAACHAPGKSNPLSVTHPLKEQCLICHKVKKS